MPQANSRYICLFLIIYYFPFPVVMPLRHHSCYFLSVMLCMICICHKFLVAFTSYLPKYAYTISLFLSLKEGILELHADICNS